jgi:hypothetical protein
VKKSTIRFLGISFGIAAIVALVHGLWLLTPARSLNVVVLDKNVAMERVNRRNDIHPNTRKHIGLFWVLRNERYVKPDTQELYDPLRDYVGPVLRTSDNAVVVSTLPQTDRHVDLLYLADAYGVEADETAVRGVTTEDMDVIDEMADNGAMVIGEFNLLSHPTPPEIRERLSALFGIEPTGWTGMYALDLGDRGSVPAWAPEIYARKYGKEWNYDGSGLILVSEEESLVVLQEGIDYRRGSFRIVVSPDHVDRFGSLSAKFYNWFEIMEVREAGQMLAEYQIDWTGRGGEDLPEPMRDGSFAAVIQRATEGGVSYYFAGEFCDYTGPENRHDAILSEMLNKVLYFDKKGDFTNFFWKFYVPFLEELCAEAYSDTAGAVRLGQR